jgi:hypothetical protein
MPLSGIYEILLRGLAGTAAPNSLSYLSRNDAHAELKRRTGQDFGYDLEKWREYIRANREPLGVGGFEKI